MKDTFRIGDGELTTIESVKPVYLSYDELEIPMTPERFEEDKKKYQIFFESQELKNIIFTPKEIQKQDMSEYYFLHLTVKIPRK